MKRIATCLLAIVLGLSCESTVIGTPSSAGHGTVKHHNHKVLPKAGWAGAGFAAGRAAGPAGSAAVGIAKYRHDLKRGGHRRTRAIAKISGPIAAGAIAGPPGVVGYAAVEHRGWIKRHILRQKPHQNAHHPSRPS